MPQNLLFDNTTPAMPTEEGFTGKSYWAARSDHQHPSDAPKPAVEIPLPDAPEGKVGESELYARADHVHPEHLFASKTVPLPDVKDGAIGTSDSMFAREDHQHPEHIFPSDEIPLHEWETGKAGESELYARADHQHPNDKPWEYVAKEDVKVWVNHEAGDDANDGLSEESPVKTLARACEIFRKYNFVGRDAYLYINDEEGYELLESFVFNHFDFFNVGIFHLDCTNPSSQAVIFKSPEDNAHIVSFMGFDKLYFDKTLGVYNTSLYLEDCKFVLYERVTFWGVASLSLPGTINLVRSSMQYKRGVEDGGGVVCWGPLVVSDTDYMNFIRLEDGSFFECSTASFGMNLKNLRSIFSVARNSHFSVINFTESLGDIREETVPCDLCLGSTGRIGFDSYKEWITDTAVKRYNGICDSTSRVDIDNHNPGSWQIYNLAIIGSCKGDVANADLHASVNHIKGILKFTGSVMSSTSEWSYELKNLWADANNYFAPLEMSGVCHVTDTYDGWKTTEAHNPETGIDEGTWLALNSSKNLCLYFDTKGDSNTHIHITLTYYIPY